MNITKEEKFLIDSFVLSKPVLSGGYNFRSLDWGRVMALADAHWLGFYLEKAIRTYKPKLKLELLKQIGRFKERERLRHLYFKRKLPHVLRALNKAKVKYAVLKGGYLAFTLFPAGARYLSDIDILVGSEEKNAAVRALFEAGFKENRKKSDKAAKVMSDVNGIEVELASELGLLKSILPVGELLENTVKVRLLGEKACVLDNEYNLLHLCLHASMTHSFYDISKLVDINEFLINRRVDMDRLEELARRKGVFRAVFLPVEFTGRFWHNRTGLEYNIDQKSSASFIEYNLTNSMGVEYDRRSAYYGYIIPVLLADSVGLKFRLVKDYIMKKVQNG